MRESALSYHERTATGSRRDGAENQAATAHVLVWQWGRHGVMPRFAAHLADGLRAVPGTRVSLSLAAGAEYLRSAQAPACDLPVETYDNLLGYVFGLARLPFRIRPLARRIAAIGPDLAVCANPGPFDFLMIAALRRARVPFVAVIHDADRHPGDGMMFQMALQRAVCQRAAALAALTAHVGERLIAQGLAGPDKRPLLRLSLPPMPFEMPAAEGRREGPLRLLMFGRLRAYKGLDLLAGALSALGPTPLLEVRVVGSGPDGDELRQLQALNGVTVENRWVAEDEIGALLAWSDAVVLPYREASQSGVASAALAAGRWVVATRVGGLPEQLAGSPRAILCDPDVEGLASGLRGLLAAPGWDEARSIDTDGPWRETAASLMTQARAAGLICRH